MNRARISGRERLAQWADWASISAVALLLAVLPLWRHRVLCHRAPEDVFFEFHDVVLYDTDVLWWLAVFAWLVGRQLRRAPVRLHTGPGFLLVPLLGLLGLGAVGMPGAVDGRYALYQVVRIAMLLALYLMLLNQALNPGVVAGSMAAAMVIQAAVAVPQFAVQASLGLQRLGELPLNPAWPGISVVVSRGERWLRAYGLAQHPNLLAGCMMGFLLVVVGYYVGQSLRQWGLLIIAIVSGLVALLVTFSRAAWLGMAVGGGTMSGLLSWMRGRREVSRRAVLTVACAVLLAILIFGVLNWQLLLPRLGLATEGVEIRSVEERASLTDAAWRLIRRRPVLGVGLGGFSTAMHQLLAGEVGYSVYQPVHNVPLLAAAELGVSGGVFWLALVVAPWVALWQRRKTVRMTGWLAGLSGALAALALVSFIDAYAWASHQGRLLHWIILGLWAREWSQVSQPAPDAMEVGS